MFPILLDVQKLSIVLVGDGEEAERRLALLDGAGAAHVAIYAVDPIPALKARAGPRLVAGRPDKAALRATNVVFTAGLAADEAERIAHEARALGRLVNTEDVRPLCDFHVPSMVRRGDLTLTVSTNGKSPGMARRLRMHLEQAFGPEWAGRLDEVAEARQGWRDQGLALPEVGKRVEQMIDEKGWLA